MASGIIAAMNRLTTTARIPMGTETSALAPRSRVESGGSDHGQTLAIAAGS